MFSVMLAPVPTYDPTVKVLKPPEGEKKIALLARLRLVVVDEALIVQVAPLVNDTLVVEVASVWIAPVSVDALALKATVLPRVALRRLPAPALAMVLLKLTVAVDGSAKIKSPAVLLMLKLSKVATALAASMKVIALPAAETVPPPEAMIDGEVPRSANAIEDACDVVTFSEPEAVTAPESACTPVD